MPMQSKIYKKFLEGLEKLGIDEETFKIYKYAGGNKGRHYNYFKLNGLLDELPEQKDKCVCNHDIVENCYLVSPDKNVLILGNCCIKRFVSKDKQGRTCEDCGASHRNRKYNLCNNCKPLPEPFYRHY